MVAARAGAAGGPGDATENVPEHWRSAPVPPDLQALLDGARALIAAQETEPFIAGSLCGTRLNKVLSTRCPGLSIPISFPIDVADIFPDGPPAPFHLHSRRLAEQCADDFNSAVNLQALRPLSNTDDPSSIAISPLFSVWQDAKSRLIFDLRELNLSASNPSFQMETLWDLPALAARAKFASKIDLAKAFWQVGVTPALADLLGCSGPDERIYRWHCLPFGLSHSPRIFTSITSTFCRAWRHAGITVLVYADDILILAESLAEHARATCLVVNDLIAAGVRISGTKAFLQPYTCLDFLGMTVHLEGSKSFSVPEKKADTIVQDAATILMAGHTQRRCLLSLLGRLTYASVACPFIPAFRVALVDAASSGTDYANMSEHIQLESAALEELKFWSDPTKGRALILDRVWPWFNFAKTRLYAKHSAPTSLFPSFSVWGDASDYGAGFNGDGQLSLPSSEILPAEIAGIPIAQTSSTARELWVILRLLQLSSIPNGSTLRVFSDNTGAVASANGSSVCKATAPVVRALFYEMLQRDIILYAQWLPREQLTDVDALSRDFNDLSHAILPASSYKRVWAAMRVKGPEIEMFSCLANRATGAIFTCSNTLEPNTVGDAFGIDPTRFTSVWAYPPFALSRTLLQWLAYHRDNLPPTGLCIPDTDFARAALRTIHGEIMTEPSQIVLPPPLFNRALSSSTRLLFATLLPLPSSTSRRTRIIPCPKLHTIDAPCIFAFTKQAPLAAAELCGRTASQLADLMVLHGDRQVVTLRAEHCIAPILLCWGEASRERTASLRAELLQHAPSHRILLIHSRDIDARAFIFSLGPSLHVLVHTFPAYRTADSSSSCSPA